MKAGKVPVIVCNPPHLQSRHSHARHLFVANDRIWIDRCGESRSSNAISDSDFIPSDDDPHGPSTPFIAIKPKSTTGRRRRQQPRRVSLLSPPSSSKPSHGVATIDSGASPKHGTQNRKRKRSRQRKAQVSQQTQSEEEKTVKKGKGKARSRLQTSSEGEEDPIDGEDDSVDDTFHMKLRSQRGSG